MTSPSHDPLISLWQTAPAPDTHHLLHDLQRMKRLHERFKRSIFAILSGMAVLLAFEEATGRLGSHGLLSAIWTVGLVAGAIRHRRARCNRSDSLTLDTVSLLKVMIARAKSDLFVARCLYAGVPCGAAAAFLLADFAGIGTKANAIPTHLDHIQTAAGVVALIIMMAAGAILARSRHRQVQALSEKLRSIEADL